MPRAADPDSPAAAAQVAEGDCIAEVPASQLEREAAELMIQHGGELPEGEPVPSEEKLA